MPNTGATTLGAIRTAAQQRADLYGSNFITTTEWNSMVNASLQQLWEKLVEAYGNDYEVQSAFAIITDGTNDHYALPTDFFKLLGVDLQLSNAGAASTTGWITIWKFNFADRNRYTLPNIQTIWGRTNLKYRLSGGNIWFIPLPMGGQSLRLWYAPRFVPLVLDADSFDGINGWEEWAINDTAMKAKLKEESPIDDLLKAQAAQEERLTHVTENRDAGSASVTVDVYAANGNYWGGGFNGDWGI